jgi:hypothetical protein
LESPHLEQCKVIALTKNISSGEGFLNVRIPSTWELFPQKPQIFMAKAMGKREGKSEVLIP